MNEISGAGATSSRTAATKDKSTLSPSDFLKLFVTQLQNQDFNNPMDNSEMMNQITQLSNMQMMQQMASYSKTSYAMSLVGKTVTASRYKNGALDTTTGTVSKVSLVDNEYVLYVSGKQYALEQIMQVQNGEDGGSDLDFSNAVVKAASVTSTTATVGWSSPTEDEVVASGLKYTVYYSEEGPFNTAELVKQGTAYGMAQSNLLGASVSGLEPETAYYINVLVTDAKGNEYVYSPVMVATKS